METVYSTLWQRNDLFVESAASSVKVWRGGRDWGSSETLELSWDECAWIIGRFNEAGVVDATDD